MIHRNQKGEFLAILCDTCSKQSPPTADVCINNGLNNMGWVCKGGTHYCSEECEKAKG